MVDYTSTSLELGLETGAPMVTPARPRSLFGLITAALLLDADAYAVIRDHRRPFKRGLQALSLVLGIVAVARLVGFGLAYLTSPQLGALQKLLHDFVTGLPLYADQVRQSPGFVVQFDQTYYLAWEGLRMALGYPTPESTAGAIVGLFVATFANWFAFGFLTYWLARWFGARPGFGRFLGVLALAYAPLLLTVVELVPGARVPAAFLFLFLLIAKYLAVKVTFNLASGYTLVTVLGSYLIAGVVVLGIAAFGLAVGLEQVPYLNDVLRTLRALSILRF